MTRAVALLVLAAACADPAPATSAASSDLCTVDNPGCSTAWFRDYTTAWGIAQYPDATPLDVGCSVGSGHASCWVSFILPLYPIAVVVECTWVSLTPPSADCVVVVSP